MTTPNPALILAAVDTAAIVGVTAWLNSQINDVRATTEANSKSLEQVGSYIRANIDPKPLVGLSQRLSEHDGYGDELESLKEQVTTLQQTVDGQGELLKEQRSMIQALIDALDKAGISYDVPDEVSFEDVSKSRHSVRPVTRISKGDTHPSLSDERSRPSRPVPALVRPPSRVSTPTTPRASAVPVRQPAHPPVAKVDDDDVLAVVMAVANS